MNELALFAGAGGGILGSVLLGWRTVCAVEIDSYCRSVLLARQRDGYLPRFPVWDDVRTFDGRPWRGHVDVISGGFPCQDISAAGQGRGITGERSGLVFEMLRIVDEVRPRFVFAENSPHLRTKGLATIVERFTRMGYVGRYGVLGAGDIGAPHKRKRMWIVANSDGEALRQQSGRGSGAIGEGAPVAGVDAENAADANGARRLQSAGGVQEFGRWPNDCAQESSDADSARLEEREGKRRHDEAQQPSADGGSGAPATRVADWWDLPRFSGVDDGVASRLVRVKATGNGQVPGVAALAWSALTADKRGNDG